MTKQLSSILGAWKKTLVTLVLLPKPELGVRHRHQINPTKLQETFLQNTQQKPGKTGETDSQIYFFQTIIFGILNGIFIHV